MATTQNFSSLLKEYMPYELLNEEMKRRNWFWSKIKKDENWMGGTLYVPFEGGEYSSIQFASLADTADVGSFTPVKGSISTYPELWGTMKFWEKDLDLHGDLKSSFLKILPNKLNQFLNRMNDKVSHHLLIGDSIATFTSNGGATGECVVDHPERFTIGEKVILDDSNSSSAAYYVISINMATKTVYVSATRGGAAADVQAFTVAQSAKIYAVGTDASTAGFTSLKSSLLSATNGGASTLYGQTKTTYPFLQAINIDGSTITASNILEKFFDAMFEVLTLGKGNARTIVCSYKHFKNCAKSLEVSRQFSVSDKQAGYGFTKITVLGAEGSMEIVGLRDMDDDVAFILDFDSMKFHGSHFFDRRRALNGQEYFEERATTGYTYLVDIRFFGDLVVSNPSYNGVIYGISYTG